MRIRLKPCHIENKLNIIKKSASFFIAVTPLCAPYNLAWIPVTVIIAVSVLAFYYLSNGKIHFSFEKRMVPLILYVATVILLSINGLLILHNVSNLCNSIIMIAFDVFIYLSIWRLADFRFTIKIANYVGYICCVYVIYQMLMLILGRDVPLGTLPFFTLTTSWVPDIWGFRFNSLFSEPSYFAIYLMPLFTYHFTNFHWNKAFLFGLFLILSSSSLGIISCVMIIILNFFTNREGIRLKLKYFIILFFSTIILYFIFTQIDFLNSMIDRTLDKIIAIVNTSFYEESRLSGHLKYYSVLPLKEKILGVGFAQLQNYFQQIGIALSNYSNALVLSLIDTGLIGFLAFITYLGFLLKESLNRGTLLFFVILVLTICTDSILLGYRFYWLTYFVYYGLELGLKGESLHG